MPEVCIRSFGLVTPLVHDTGELAGVYGSPPRERPSSCATVPSAQDMPPRELRRMARLTRLALYSADRACRDADVVGDPGCGLIVGLTHGSTSLLKEFHDYLFDYGPQMASPGAFSNGVTNAALGAVSKHCNLTRGGFTVVGSESCGMEVLHQAARCVSSGQYDRVCAGAAEEYSELVAGVYRRLGWYEGKLPPCLPYGEGQRGVAQSEAAVFAVLSGDRADGEGVCTFTPLDSLEQVGDNIDVVISGAGGGPQDPHELAALRLVLSRQKGSAAVLFPKVVFGETFAAGGMIASAIAWDIVANRRTYPAYPREPSLGTAGSVPQSANRVLAIAAGRGGDVLAGLFSRAR